MKTFLKFLPLLFCASLLFMSCDKEEAIHCEDIVCVDDCMFALTTHDVEVTFLSCFDRMGFMYFNDEYNIALIPDELPNEYNVEGMQVQICGMARENSIPLSFPDPSVGEVYQFKTIDIVSR